MSTGPFQRANLILLVQPNIALSPYRPIAMFQLDGSSLLFFAGMALITFILLRRGQRYNKRRKRAELREENRKVDHFSQMPGMIDDSQSSERLAMHRSERDLSAHLDTKARLIQALLIEARRERAALQQAMQEAEQRGIPFEKSDTLSMLEEALSAPAEKIQNSIAQWNQAVQNQTKPMPSQDKKGKDIYSLADSGYSARQIAEQIGSALGDVELLLSLRKNA